MMLCLELYSMSHTERRGLASTETSGKFLLYYVRTLNSGFSDFVCRLFIVLKPFASFGHV